MKKVVKGMDKLGKDFYEDLFYDKEELMKTVSFDEGVKQGKEAGEKEKSIEIAKKMLKKEYSLDEISEMTELPIEKIEKLK